MSHNKNKQKKFLYNKRPQRQNQKLKRNKQKAFKLKSQFLIDRNDNERLKQQNRIINLSKLIIIKPCSSFEINKSIHCKFIKKEKDAAEEAEIILKLKESANTSMSVNKNINFELVKKDREMAETKIIFKVKESTKALINVFIENVKNSIKEEIKNKNNERIEENKEKDNIDKRTESLINNLNKKNNENYLNNFTTQIQSETKEQNGDCYKNEFSSSTTNLKTEFRKSSIINSIDFIWTETNNELVSNNSPLICQPKSIKELELSTEITASEQKNNGYFGMNFVFEFFAKMFNG
ncbi:hypothetical protein ACQ4LE_010611 [Meloidogyne hapla]|uniref:Uncharacterized protein n=1 Tax=Meloidogyne hapla TaxID=6305 RepID=A0A1I8BP59_MELHA